MFFNDKKIFYYILYNAIIFKIKVDKTKILFIYRNFKLKCNSLIVLTLFNMLILCSHAVLPIKFDRLSSTATKITFLFLSQYTMGSKIYICSLFPILFTFVLLHCSTRRKTIVYSYYLVTGISGLNKGNLSFIS